MTRHLLWALKFWLIALSGAGLSYLAYTYVPAPILVLLGILLLLAYTALLHHITSDG